MAETVVEVQVTFFGFLSDAESAPKRVHKCVARLDDVHVVWTVELDTWIPLWREQFQLAIREVRCDNTNCVAAVVAQSAMVVESPFCIVSYPHFAWF